MNNIIIVMTYKTILMIETNAQKVFSKVLISTLHLIFGFFEFIIFVSFADYIVSLTNYFGNKTNE